MSSLGSLALREEAGATDEAGHGHGMVEAQDGFPRRAATHAIQVQTAFPHSRLNGLCLGSKEVLTPIKQQQNLVKLRETVSDLFPGHDFTSAVAGLKFLIFPAPAAADGSMVNEPYINHPSCCRMHP